MKDMVDRDRYSRQKHGTVGIDMVDRDTHATKVPAQAASKNGIRSVTRRPLIARRVTVGLFGSSR